MKTLRRVQEGQFFVAPEIGASIIYMVYHIAHNKMKSIRYTRVGKKLVFNGVATFNLHDSGNKDVIVIDVNMEADF